MRGFKRGRVAIACAALVVAIGGPAVVATASTAHASGTEVLASGDQAAQTHSQFTIFASGSGNTATGEMGWWNKGFPTSTTGWKWATATVTCSMITGNIAIITGTATIDGVALIVVAQAVDNSNPSSAGHSDRIRFSFAPTITQVSPGCYTPALAPIRVKSGDIRVGL